VNKELEGIARKRSWPDFKDHTRICLERRGNNMKIFIRVVGLDVLTALFIKISVLWDVKQCSPTFRRKMSPPSSGMKRIQNWKPA
jgi:hypothetical protein